MEHRITPGRVQIGKFSLYYERAGSGRPIVFLHGLGGNHLSWWNQVPYFMREYECITIDQRGFAMSPDPDGTFNSAHPSDLGALLDELKIEKAALVGQSMGGWTIVGYALEHPERVGAMVMAGTPGGIITREMAANFPPRSAAPLSIEGAPIGSLPTYAPDYFARRPELAYLYDALRIFGARPPDDALGRIGGRRYDPALARERLTMPILCIVGDQDALIGGMMKILAPSLPTARLIEIPHCGHSTYWECPEVFNQFVRDFLRAVGWGHG